MMISFLALLVVGPVTASASSKSPYESGYDHGCDDADISDPDDRYINQPEKGPSFHTNEFMRGYNDGYDECSGDSGGGGSSDEDGGDSDGSRSDAVRDFCSALRRGDYVEAEALLGLLDYGSISIGARVLCGIVGLAE